MMAASKPRSLTLRSYQVGFGDCFLLSFHYSGKIGDRHVLIDFGSTGQKKSIGENLMLRVAQDIKKQCGGKLHAVVAAHRHKDHISGFATNKRKTAPGDIIASCKPDVVLQPWTEHPKARVNATVAPGLTDRQSFVAALGNMHEIAAAVLVEAERRKSVLGPMLMRELSFIGEDNLSNLSAAKSHDYGQAEFLFELWLEVGTRESFTRCYHQSAGPTNLETVKRSTCAAQPRRRRVLDDSGDGQSVCE